MSRLKKLELGLDQFVKILVVPVLMKISMSEMTGEKVKYETKGFNVYERHFFSNNRCFCKNKRSNSSVLFAA